MFKLKRIVLLVAASAVLSGCTLLRYELSYELIRTDVLVDPTSGDIRRTSYWRYGDGSIAITTDITRRGEDNEQRRGERLAPPARFVEP